jgi:hypothetical protein
MQISHSRRFIFIHIFKTAGTSIAAVLEPYTEWSGYRLWRKFCAKLGSPLQPEYPGLTSHARAVEIQGALPKEMYDSYFKFAFVRSPWDWQVSWYHYILQDREHHEHETVAALDNFEDFLRWRTDNPVRHQYEFVKDANGNAIVDFIGRFENLQTDFDHVCATAGIKATLPHLNRSRHDDYRRYYSDRACALLENYSKCDIECFGYRFDPLHVDVLLPLANSSTSGRLRGLRAA